VGPASERVIREVMETGGSPTVERAIDASGRRADIERRRALRRGRFRSRAEVLRGTLFATRRSRGPALASITAPLQMHSEWTRPAVRRWRRLLQACRESWIHLCRRHRPLAHGLKIAAGMFDCRKQPSQRRAIRRG
jgi:hypothetical protein